MHQEGQVVKGCCQALRDMIKTTLKIDIQAISHRYLDMPTDVVAPYMELFKFLRDSIWSKVKVLMKNILPTRENRCLLHVLLMLSYFFYQWHASGCFQTMKAHEWWGIKQGQIKP
jgi:hypothetical protein